MPAERKPSLAPDKLPRLAFGNQVLPEDNSVQDLSSRLERQARPVQAISLPDAPHGFQGRMATLAVGAQEFAAFAHTPVTVAMGEGIGCAVLIPSFGSMNFTTAETRYTARAGHSIAFTSAAARIVETTLDSHVAVRLDTGRLQRTARSMLGLQDGEAVDLRLEHDRELLLNPGGLPMGRLLEQFFDMVDMLPTASLGLLALDELFYRHIAVLLSPHVAEACIGPDALRQVRPSRREVDLVCEYILAHLSDPITLTDLEQLSGLSQRMLQLAFQQQFQCSPLQWLRRARLDLARRQLSAARPGDSVTRIALATGFPDLGRFSQAYLARFDELPSQTLRRAAVGR